MQILVGELMTEVVVTGTPQQTVGNARKIMNDNRVHAIPIVEPDGKLVGILTASDLMRHTDDDTPVSQVMIKQVHTVPRHADTDTVIRIMRHQHTHHVVVTDGDKIVGVVSSFDLLRLVENYEFGVRDAPGGS